MVSTFRDSKLLDSFQLLLYVEDSNTQSPVDELA